MGIREDFVEAAGDPQLRVAASGREARVVALFMHLGKCPHCREQIPIWVCPPEDAPAAVREFGCPAAVRLQDEVDGKDL